MGYRSDVKIVFYLTHGTIDPSSAINALINQGKTTLPFAALKLWFDENYPVAEAKGEWCAEIKYGDDYILLNYYDVKWYSGYVHPEAVEKAFAKFSDTFRSDERDHQAQYEMLRVGEQDDDIEADRSSYADHRLSVVRDIVFE